MKTNQKSRRTCTPHVRTLFYLGIPEGDIAKLVGKTETAVKKQIRRLGGVEAFPGRARTQEEAYRDIFDHYSKLKRKNTNRNRRLCDLLAKRLDLTDDAIRMFFRGMYFSVGGLRHFIPVGSAFEACANLLEECFKSSSRPETELETIERFVLLERTNSPECKKTFGAEAWLAFLVWQKEHFGAPDIESQLHALGYFAIWINEQCEDRLAPQVTFTTIRMVDHCLAKLKKRDRTIIEMRFGFHERPADGDEICRKTGLKHKALEGAVQTALSRLKKQPVFQALLLSLSEAHDTYLNRVCAKYGVKLYRKRR